MMGSLKPNDATNIGVGKPKATGSIFIAPTGTELPKDASTPLDAAKFKNAGYISPDGVSISDERDSSDLTAWGGDIVYTSQTSYKESCTFTPIEINQVVYELTYGADAITAASGKLDAKHTGAERKPVSIVIEIVPNTKTVRRYVIPTAKLTEIGDLDMNDDDSLGRELTFAALPDKDGVTCYEYNAITGFTVEA